MPNAFDRRRAERFAQLMDEADGGRRHHARSTVDDELSGLVALGCRIRDLEPPAGAGREFRAGLRAMLIATAVRDGIGVTAVPEAVDDCGAPTRPVPARTGWRLRLPRPVRARLALYAGVLAGAVAVASISVASDAVPGDALYGMKRHTERAQLAFTNSDLNRAQLLLTFARERLDEATAVRGDTVGFASALDDMDDDATAGARLLTSSAARRKDPTTLDIVDVFLIDQRRRVAALTSSVNRVERERAMTSLALLDSIRKRSELLRTALLCGAVPSSRTDDLGPLPRTCPSEGTGPGGSPTPSAGTPRTERSRPDQGRPETPAERSNTPDDLPTGSPGGDTSKLIRPQDNKPDDGRPAGGKPPA